ncbi:stage VI sporulation protein D [Halobacillus sp. A1]|uniref:stage VI sporulation protein D n=1 Tax=Halobacillus sp. A1 TaxID=2880262 RepID=UPI0020A6A44A|nr:stage VI sporulation protein D [Halobacillus sp. A1]MCP3030480.1 stage VI sporulation protein D [Halobacillus sp. A1]
MQNNQEFTFYLDESLWFKEGQGVNELLGISLDPDVSITDLGEEVRLHGFVVLSGEYIPNPDIEPYRNQDAIPVGRVLEVADAEDGVAEFSHSFPVEITVAKDRVDDLDEVVINIESFDYELPEPANLSLHAQISMMGIKQEQTAAPEKDGHEMITIGPVRYTEEETLTVDEVDLKKDFEEEPLPVDEVSLYENTEEDSLMNERYETYEESSRKEKTQSLSEFFYTNEKEIEETELVEDEGDSETYEVENVSNVEEESSPSVNGFKQIFQHLFPNRDETYTQMKMYIVQEDETIQMIAERYEVPVKQLEKVNGVEDEVSPGQIVYIPN